MDIILNTVD